MEYRGLADYVKMPTFEEYKEMFKNHFDLKREDGILQVTMQTNGDVMRWSGAAHKAMAQLMTFISLDPENEVLIWTHQGPEWMQNSDPKGWEVYDKHRFDGQYIDDYNLINKMVNEITIPTIGAMQGPGFHWDSCMLCDITLASEDCRWDDFHYQYGLVPGDGMMLIMQHLLGTKRANYLMYTSRQWDAKQALEWGWISEICPKGKVLDRAWEIARLIKSIDREPRMITANLAKRPMQRMVFEDLRVHTLSEQYSTLIMLGKGEVGDGKRQMNEADSSDLMNWRYAHEVDTMLQPQSLDTWDYKQNTADWLAKKKEENK